MNYELIEQSEFVYCYECGTFQPPEWYFEYCKTELFGGIHCIKCGGNMTTANNINKIINKIKEVKK